MSMFGMKNRGIVVYMAILGSGKGGRSEVHENENSRS